MKKPKIKRVKGSQLKGGDVYHLVRLGWEDKDRPEEFQSRWVADHDDCEPHCHTFEVIGKAKQIKIPGLIDHCAWLYEGTLYVGCQKIDALRTFKILARALGYEVDP